MRYKFARRSYRLILVIVGVCSAMSATDACHAGFSLSEGCILGEAELRALNTLSHHMLDLPTQGESRVSTSSSIFLPIALIDGRNDRGVAGHGDDLGSALEYHVPSGWIREGEYLHPIDIPLITHELPCYVSTHDPNDPAQGPISGSAAADWK
jgi:hypothetical protein